MITAKPLTARRLTARALTALRLGETGEGAWSPAALFASGGVGTYSDINTYATNYFGDAGVTPAAPGDPVYQINDQSGNGLNWVQATATARPKLSARYNGFTDTDTLLTSAWIRGGAFVESTLVPAPKEGEFARKIVEDAGTGMHRLGWANSALVSGERTFSIYLKAAERSYVVIRPQNPGTWQNFGGLDLITGDITPASSSNSTISAEPVGDGWFKVSVTSVWNDFSGDCPAVYLCETPWDGVAGNGVIHSYAGDGVSGVYVWGPDLKFPEDYSKYPQYQRVGDLTTDPNDYDTEGFPLYLECDLGDDAMTTDGSLPAGTYEFAIPTQEGIFYDTIIHAGGPVTFGPTSYTGGPTGILTVLATGDKVRLVGPPMITPVMTADQKTSLTKWLENRGAGSADLFGDDFVMFVETTTASETFTIPTQDVGTFDATVDWGDGTTSTITAYNDADLTHTYAAAGTHRIRISGSFPNIYFSGAGDRLKVVGIGNWGDVGWTRLNSAFYGCSNMQFGLQLGHCNTSSVTTMNSMFQGCTSLTSLDVSGFDTSSVTNMSNMFFGCTSLASLDVSGWNITSLTAATGFMYGASNALTQTEYDATLVAWEAQAEKPDVTIHFGAATYTAGSAAATARAALVANGWAITDGGAV